MTRIIFFSCLLICIGTKSYSQQINPADLIGTWDESAGKHAATIEFVDSARVRYSYKGHTGSTRSYYYILHMDSTPVILTVDYSKKHKKHRNEYLIAFADKDTLKLQVLFKKDSRDHFSEEAKHKPVLLVRRKMD